MDGSAEIENPEKAFFALSSDLLAVIDGAQTVLRLNPSWKDQLGHDPSSLLGRTLLQLVAPRDRQRVQEMLTAALSSGGARTFDAHILKSSQQLRLAHITATPSPDRGRLYIVARDITVRQRLERELASARQLEAIGQLASGVAHEINTPIQFVGDNLTFLGDSFLRAKPVMEFLGAWDLSTPPGPEFIAELARMIPEADLAFLASEVPMSIASACEGVERVAQLVRSLREFAHTDTQKMVPADLNRAIERTVAVARSEWKYVAEVKLELSAIPPVQCHLSAINQVLLNLLCNASHAIGEKQKSQGEGAPKGTIRVVSSTDGQFVTIAVRDTGAGIPLAIRARIFEPFFTTKEVGRGTGQGLAISRTIVCEKHKGRLDFDSEEGVGTTFYMRLPIEPEVEAEVSNETSAAR